MNNIDVIKLEIAVQEIKKLRDIKDYKTACENSIKIKVLINLHFNNKEKLSWLYDRLQLKYDEKKEYLELIKEIKSIICNKIDSFIKKETELITKNKNLK